MRTLLLCGYRSGVGLERRTDGKLIVDQRISELQKLGCEVICVLAGGDADEILRSSRKLMDTELVFDTNGDAATLITNLKAGLASTDGESCFAIPLEVAPPSAELWHTLHSHLRNQGFHTPVCVLQAVETQGAPWHYGFPLLFTRSGNTLLREVTGFTSLVDTRLKYQHVVFSTEANLAPDAFPL